MTTLHTTVGRCNPPTPFHFALLSLILSKEGDKKFYLSSTIDKKNPLSYEKKKELLEFVYPESKDIISNECNNFIGVLKKHSKQYSNIVFYCGVDRVQEYQRIIDKYNHKEFDYDNVTLVSVGSDYIRGIVSASKLRQSFFDGCDLFPCFTKRYQRMKFDVQIILKITFPDNIDYVSYKIYKALEEVGYRRTNK